jgi:mono/diheme cytochrome c family protein
MDFGVHAGMGHSDALLFFWISHGVPETAMPAFAGRLSAAERWHVINFIRNFRPAAD